MLEDHVPIARKLLIQIPCWNEEVTLPLTLAGLPSSVPGFATVEYLVVDDGSTDRTVEVARSLGVHHIVSFGAHRGLAAAFSVGLETALRCGADVVVNTDGDNQYRGEDVTRLVRPILDGSADVVIGERNVSAIDHFSLAKKILAWVGSRVVSLASGIDVSDAPSGFRAFSRRAAREIRLVDNYSHTLETLIQARSRGLSVAAVPVRVNAKTRESRLARSTARYVLRSAVAIALGVLVHRWPRTATAAWLQGPRRLASRWIS